MAANRSIAPLVAAALACGAAFADEPAAAPGAAGSLEHASLAELESAFWICDYVATTEGVIATPRAACRYVTEEVKRQKFGGNFQQFLQWWRDNKADEHARLRRLKEG